MKRKIKWAVIIMIIGCLLSIRGVEAKKANVYKRTLHVGQKMTLKARKIKKCGKWSSTQPFVAKIVKSNKTSVTIVALHQGTTQIIGHYKNKTLAFTIKVTASINMRPKKVNSILNEIDSSDTDQKYKHRSHHS